MKHPVSQKRASLDPTGRVWTTLGASFQTLFRNGVGTGRKGAKELEIQRKEVHIEAEEGVDYLGKRRILWQKN